MNSKADAYQALPFKLIFFVLVAGGGQPGAELRRVAADSAPAALMIVR